MRIATIMFAVLIATLANPATEASAADEIYRWVDENGVVHFGDRPPANATAEILSIQPSTSSDTATAPDSDSADPGTPAEPQPSAAQQKRAERAGKRAELEANEKIIAEACAQRRTIVSQLEPSTRVMVQMEDGTVERMDDNVRLETLNEAKTYIADNCDG